ncbi:RCC1 domain-containing protein [Cohnella nanjingensis]|uniref:Copper amine oxidase-like N-terminal domain-containing protein n=1 Tax=Cohnella nanjingensis TaxID=1387779 RepID=A0A7X0RWC2_9BACL|nr:stalk domain-containing protein [Cohnella nanjingensis]MBB6674868.1 hypothetical protein [Cohnella nanjingensis]
MFKQALALTLSAALALSSAAWMEHAKAEAGPQVERVKPGMLYKKDGTAWQFGDGTTLPTRVLALSNIREAFGWRSDAFYAWRLNGTVWRYPTGAEEEPEQVANLTHVVDVSDADGYALAVRKDGTVWAWGSNRFGQLANGKLGNQDVVKPQRIASLSNIIAVSAQRGNNIALARDGTVYTWGQLIAPHKEWYDPLSAKDMQTRPKRIPELRHIIKIDGTFALREDGTVFAWGNNYYGQLGIGAPKRTYIATPRPVTLLAGQVRSLSVSSNFALFMTKKGEVWGSGLDLSGQLMGQTSHGSSNLPLKLPGLRGVKQVAAGAGYGLALNENGSVYAWGLNRRGELGIGSAGYPVREAASYASAQRVAHTVAIRIDGREQAEPALIRDDTAYVPVKTVADAAGAVIAWTEYSRKQKVMVVQYGGRLLQGRIGSTQLVMDGQPVMLKTPLSVVNNRVVLPARLLAEWFGTRIDWDEKTGEVRFDAVQSK